MKKVIMRISAISTSVFVLTLALTSSAYAHVVVKPAEVLTAGFQTFTVGVPNEKDIAVTGVKLIIPEGMNYVSPTQKTGWNITVEKEGSGEDAAIKSITWEGGTVNAGFREDFTFSGQVPDKDVELQWKAYQTYSDGTVVSWDKSSDSKEEGENSGPYSVTKVVSKTESEGLVQASTDAAAKADANAMLALYIGGAGLALGAAAVFVSLRKK